MSFCVIITNGDCLLECRKLEEIKAEITKQYIGDLESSKTLSKAEITERKRKAEKNRKKKEKKKMRGQQKRLEKVEKEASVTPDNVEKSETDVAEKEKEEVEIE